MAGGRGGRRWPVAGGRWPVGWQVAGGWRPVAGGQRLLKYSYCGLGTCGWSANMNIIILYRLGMDAQWDALVIGCS